MKHLVIMIIIFSVLIEVNCSRNTNKISKIPPTINQLKVEKLEELEKSILKITCTAYYEHHFYRQPSNIGEKIPQQDLETDKNITSNSVAATGLIIYQDGQKMVLLTCHHVFDFQDTLETYYLDRNKNKTDYLSSRSILLGKNIYAFHKNGRSTRAELLSFDKANDLALVLSEPGNILLSEFSYQGSFGDADNLRLGQEVYLLGFPKGFFMVTRALVSPSTTRKKFLVDASFNQGFSGGIVIAFNEMNASYEYLGMSNSVAYSSELILVPSGDSQNLDKYSSIPYTEDVFVRELNLINYGITFVVKSNEVIKFMESEMQRLKHEGHFLRLNIKKSKGN